MHEYSNIYHTTKKVIKINHYEICYAQKLEPLERFRNKTTEHLQQLSVEIPFDFKGEGTLTEGGDRPIMGHTWLEPNSSFPLEDNKSLVVSGIIGDLRENAVSSCLKTVNLR